MLDTLNPWEAREQAFDIVHERTLKASGEASTELGQAIIRKYLKDTTAAVVALKDAETSRLPTLSRAVEIITALDPELVSLSILHEGINAVSREFGMAHTCVALGRGLENEVWAQNFYEMDAKAAAQIELAARRRAGSLKQRRQSARIMAKKKGYTARKWTKEETTQAGSLLINCLVDGGAFVLVPFLNAYGQEELRLEMVSEALEHGLAFVQTILDRYPVHMPLLKAPKPWKGIVKELEFEGRKYSVPLVRKDCKMTQQVLKETVRSGKMDGVLEALNGIEQTPWAISEHVLELIHWCYDNKVSVPGLPPQEDLLPSGHSKPRAQWTQEDHDAWNEQWESWDEDQRKAWRIGAAKVSEANRSFIGQRQTLLKDLATARLIVEGGNKFFTPCNVDYRGRVYYLPQFNFQRQDYVRSLFQFTKGEPLGERGLYWLKVHIANCGDFDKVSKKPFEDRVAWVEANEDLIFKTATMPREHLEWTKADAPFMFYAACSAYVASYAGVGTFWDRQEDMICNLPVNFDGSCSGLQHLAAMTKCELTAPLVNVAPTDRPSDIYQTVWDKVLPKFQWDAEHSMDPDEKEMAQKVLQFGGGRSLVKRNVMVYSYGSKQYGMGQQHEDDLMKPLALDVLMKKYGEHPFLVAADTKVGKDGNEYTRPGSSVAKYLARHIFQTIQETVQKPAEAMAFLQKIAKTMAHEGKPVIWHTPLGFPVVLMCPNVERKKVRLYLMDRGVLSERNTRIAQDAPGIDKNKAANTIAPGFVHSMDACHLMMVVNASRKEGIREVALVHDSFGCLPSQADRFREILVEQFHWMYAQFDVLGDILAEAHEQIQTNSNRLPEAIDKGSLDIQEVLNATYAFA